MTSAQRAYRKQVTAFRILTALYMMALFVSAFWPFQFIPICASSSMHRLENGAGLRLGECSALSTVKAPRGLYQALRHADGISVEVHLAPETNDQRGPARIVSYSLDTQHRNFTLGQDGDALVLRLRTTATDLNGSRPQLDVPGVFAPGVARHIIITYDGTLEKVFIDGRPAHTDTALTGRMTSWDPDYQFLLGNELTGNRPWRGELYLVALYNRALTEAEVQRNYANATAPETVPRIRTGLVSHLPLNETTEGPIRDRIKETGVGELENAAYQGFVQTLFGRFPGHFYTSDMVINVLGFMPLPFLTYQLFTRRFRSTLTGVYGLPCLIGLTISAGIEFGQQFTLYRNTNFWDIIYNVSGTMAGAMLLHLWTWRRVMKPERVCSR